MSEHSRYRIAALTAFFLVLQLIVLARAAWLTLLEGEPLRVLAGRQHEYRVELPAERGSITDRNGENLALSVPAESVYLRPKQFKPTQQSVAEIAQTLGLARSTVEKAATSTKSFVWLKRRASDSEGTAVEKLANPGVGTESASRRVYPQGDLASQLLGISNIDDHGIEGLELKFNAVLQGETGVVVVERDAHGRPMLSTSMRRPVPRQGARVELTIDSALQHVAEKELEQTLTEFDAASGLILALDPHTAEVLVMAQLPRFDPNEPDAAKKEAWRNKAITDCFEPGSTMKPFVVSTALDQHEIRPSDRFFCENGSYNVGGRTVRDHEPYGWLTVPEIIQHSSNICTGKIGERLGRERLGKALHAFGFGHVTGIDLPGEVPGIFPDWQKWGRIHVVTNSFGQGSSVTAMQLATAYAAIANGGHLMRPYVVRRVVGGDGQTLLENHPQVVTTPISPAAAKTITEMMELVVEAGTATRAQIPGVKVAGKTGTAQKVDPKTHRYSLTDRTSSFVGFAPADNPRIVVAVVIDRPRNARYGGMVAAPAFKRFTEYALQTMGVSIGKEPNAPYENRKSPRADNLQEARALAPSAPMQTFEVALQTDPGGVPTVIGRSMRDTIALLDKRGYQPEVEGWGIAVAQDPPAGTQAPDGSAVRVRFDTALR